MPELHLFQVYLQLKYLFYQIKLLLILANSSIYSPPLIIIPFLVPLVIADTMDTGVDITKAHGQEITKSVNAL